MCTGVSQRCRCRWVWPIDIIELLHYVLCLWSGHVVCTLYSVFFFFFWYFFHHPMGDTHSRYTTFFLWSVDRIRFFDLLLMYFADVSFVFESCVTYDCVSYRVTYCCLCVRIGLYRKVKLVHTTIVTFKFLVLVAFISVVSYFTLRHLRHNIKVAIHA